MQCLPSGTPPRALTITGTADRLEVRRAAAPVDVHLNAPADSNAHVNAFTSGNAHVNEPADGNTHASVVAGGNAHEGAPTKLDAAIVRTQTKQPSSASAGGRRSPRPP
jgi:hypothetical protein